MAIFGKLNLEKEIQTNDKTRLDASKSFLTKGEAPVTLVRIEPEAGQGFIDITDNNKKNWFLDWSYEGLSRDVTVSLEITTDGMPVVFTETIEVITTIDDNLLSNDKDIVSIESEILDFVPDNRASFLNVHRQARDLILAELDTRGITNHDFTKITKEQLFKEDFNKWSSFLVLSLIYNDLSNSVEDVFSAKSKQYKTKVNFYRDRVFMRIDKNRDGVVSVGEFEPVNSLVLDRRR